MQDTLGLVLGGGRGAPLYPLTKTRSVPAVPIAGKYRIIDIPISNCLNSGVGRIYVLTQFLSVSLHRHIANTYKFDPFNQGFVEVLAAQQTNETSDWYQGTADAVRQNVRYVHEDGARYVLVISGDQIYRMDFRLLLKTHQETGADVTLALAPVNRERAPDYGVVRLDDSGRVTTFVEKPQSAAQLDQLRMPAATLAARGFTGTGREYLANMGIYLFSRDALFHLLSAPASAVDFAREIFPRCLQTRRLQGHLFDGYFEDVGSIKAYHAANLALAGEDPPFDFHSAGGVVFTRKRYLPASRVSGADLVQSAVSDGCVIQSGTRIERCVIGVRSRIGRDVTLRDTVIIGADRYETDADRAANRQRGLPDFTVGDGSLIERAILDKDCRIGRDVRIVNRRGLTEDDGDNYVIRDGIVIIPNGAVVRDETII